MQASLAKRLFWRQHLAEAQAQLQRLKTELPTVEMMMAVPFLFQGKGYYRTLELKQNMVELLGLVNLLRPRELKRVCEIGTFKGGTRCHQEFIETTDARRKIGIGIVFND